MRILDLLPGSPLVWVAGAALAGSVAFGAVQSLRLADVRAALAREQRDRAEDMRRLETAARVQVERFRAVERGWNATQAENAALARKARDLALEHEAAAGAAADRLRGRLAAVAATCRAAPGNPALVGPGRAASAPADLLADVFGRLDASARRIAAYADAAGIRGEQCAADYKALRAASDAGR